MKKYKLPNFTTLSGVLVIISAVWIHPILSAELLRAITSGNTVVYESPSKTSRPLAKPSAGMSIEVEPILNGWYKTNFKKQYMGKLFGWIPADHIQLKTSKSAKTSSKNIPNKNIEAKAKGWVSLDATYLRLRPSNFQTAIAQENRSVSGTAFGVTYGIREVFYSLGAALTLRRFSVHDNLQGLSVGTYGATGYQAILKVAYPFFYLNGINFSGVAGLGAALITVDETIDGQEVSTANIIAPTFSLAISLQQFFSNQWGVDGTLGYIILNATSASALQGSTKTSADMDLSGPTLGLSILYGF